jgi:excisionase family DNA binding protein
MTDQAPPGSDTDRLLTPGEAARLAHRTTDTLARWERAGKIRTIRTAGGHRRYYEDDILALLNGDGGQS